MASRQSPWSETTLQSSASFGCLVVRAMDLRLDDHVFDSQPIPGWVTILGQATI